MNAWVLRAGFLLLFAAADGAAQVEAYPAGEVLHYRVKLRYGFLSTTAGEAVMSVRSRESVARPGEEARQAARLQLRMKSTGLVSRLCPLDYRATSLVDVASGGTLHFRVAKKERDKMEREDFTHAPGAAVVESRRLLGPGSEQRRTIEVEGPVQDTLSLFYHLRRMKLALGVFEDATVFQQHKPYALRFAADGLERFKVKGVGVFWALVVHPSAAVPGLFSGEGDATMWLEETTHVMLRMTVKNRHGSATMSLVKVERSPLLRAPRASGRRGTGK